LTTHSHSRSICVLSALIFLFCRFPKGHTKADCHRRLRCLSACRVRSTGAISYCVRLE